MRRTSADPLAPIGTAASVLLRLVALGVLVELLLLVTGHGNVSNWFSGPVCATAINYTQPIATALLKPGVSGNTHWMDVCTQRPSAGQHALSVLTQLPGFLLFVAALLLIWLLVRGVHRDGLYTARMAAQLRGLGWLLGLGGLAVMVIQGEAASFLATTMVNPAPGPTWPSLEYWQVPTVTLLTALGVLSFARIVRVGKVMRDDLDRTV